MLPFRAPFAFTCQHHIFFVSCPLFAFQLQLGDVRSCRWVHNRMRAGHDVKMARRSPKRPRRLKKPLSISLSSNQRLLLAEAPRSFNNYLLNLLATYFALPLFVYLHTIPLTLTGHLAAIAAMIYALHLTVSFTKGRPI